ncbi:DUF1772 domain-containing protein [Salipiger sp.]|uniref:anthrone oxygenase family protein n=1 Tax=Salipiger sp. TaxID=2078585 RepID=UPI003A982576
MMMTDITAPRTPPGSAPHRLAAVVATLFSGAIFGFFYAWICSTMWGLDAADPRVAIAAMQAMNNSVRNAVFAPAFFGTPAMLVLAALLCLRAQQRRAAGAFGAAALVYGIGGLGLTMAVNVPMNEALAGVAVPASEAEAQAIWQAWSPDWQAWNILRTLASGLTLALSTLGLLALR